MTGSRHGREAQPGPPRSAVEWLRNLLPRARGGYQLLAPGDLALAAGAGSAAGLVYWLGSAPGVLFGDGGELQFAAYSAGLPHPTGYPLYMILGWAWTHLLQNFQLATPARAMNLLSVIFAALAVSLTYLMAHALIELSVPPASSTVQRLGGLLAALTFALTPTFWSQAVVAEVYALHAVFVALLLGLAIRWRKRLEAERAAGQPGPLTMRSKPTAALVVMALVLGLSLAHHRTTLLLVPVLLVYVWRQDGYRLRHPRWLLRLSALVAVPLLLYLYIPLRAPRTPYLQVPLNPDRPLQLIEDSPAGLINYTLGSTFSGQFQGVRKAMATVPAAISQLLTELTGVGLGLAALGLLFLAVAGPRRLLWLTGGSFALLAGFNLFYGISDIRVFYIAPTLVATTWIGVAGAFVAHELTLMARRWRPTRDLATRVGLVSLLVLFSLPALLFIRYADQVDRSGHTRPQRWWENILASTPPTGSVLISNDRDEIMPLWYAQQVDQSRPDLIGIFPGLLPGADWATIGQVAERGLASGRPVFLIKPMEGLEVKARMGVNNAAGLTPVLDLATNRSPQRPQDLAIGESMRLVGYDASPVHVSPGQALEVDLFWQPLQRMETDLFSFVHLEGPDGTKLTQSDHAPGGVYYPTSQWTPGETLLDRHRLTVPANAPDGPYRLRAGLYELASQEVRNFGAAALSGSVGGQPPASARNTTLANPFYANLNDEVLLIGYAVGGEPLAASPQNGLGLAVQQSGRQTAPPGLGPEDVWVTLLWQAASPMVQDYTVFLHLLDQDGTIVAQRDDRPFAGSYPTSVWEQGEVLADTHVLRLPTALAPGPYRLAVGFYITQTRFRLPVFDNADQPLPNDRIELVWIDLNGDGESS